MSNPVLVEVTRGKLVESRHRGAVAVADADGAIVLGLGDVAAPIFPRSAIKAVQALVLVESGGADRFGFGDAELALACASHGGEPGHVATVERMLAAGGSMPLRSPAGRTGHCTSLPLGRSRARAGRRPRCTTTARASMRASCAPPAR